MPQKKQSQQQTKKLLRQKTLVDYQNNLISELESLSSNKIIAAGVDEAGRGSLAGPVFAASVILDPENVPLGIDDSKKLSQKARESVCEEIIHKAIAWSVGTASVSEIEELNIGGASLLAMKRAINGLQTSPSYILVDGPFKIETDISQKGLINGDALCVSIAAASIIAKVKRDALMCELMEDYPYYSFDKHKGYGTKLHLEEIKEFGPSKIHRKNFRGVY